MEDHSIPNYAVTVVPQLGGPDSKRRRLEVTEAGLSSSQERATVTPTTREVGITQRTAIPLRFASTVSFGIVYKGSNSPLNNRLFRKKHPEEGLKRKECEMWASPTAARFAALHYLPGHVGRRLGTITKVLTSSQHADLADVLAQTAKFKHQGERASPVVTGGTPKAPSKPQAKKDLQLLGTRANRQMSWIQDWSQLLQSSHRMNPQWEGGSGERVVATRVQDKVSATKANELGVTNFPSRRAALFSCHELLTLLQKEHLQDPAPQQTVPMYQGLRQTKVDAQSVLAAIMEISTPVPELYAQPLMAAVPVLQENGTDENGHPVFSLQIGIYSNRLLFEVMTQHLEIVMVALDKGSLSIARPLEAAPSVTGNPESIFASDPWPQVVTGALPTMDDDNDASSSSSSDPTNTRSEDYIDAFSTPGFLKLIENHGTNVQDDWPLLQQKLQGRLAIQLMLHQIHGVCWMWQMEQVKGGLNALLWEERQFPEGDSYYYSPALGQLRLRLDSKTHITGGILSDEMGLGKTVQVIALILATLEDLKLQASSRPDNHQHSTLIIVPPALVSQWVAEVQKIAGDSLVVDFFCHRRVALERQSKFPTTATTAADVVITTYQALEATSGQKKAKRKSLQFLANKQWGRVVLDEMQEIRSWTKTISKGCQLLTSNRRWMLSGTPITQSIDDFRGELCFLGLEPFAASSDDGFFKFAVSNHWDNRSAYGLEILRILSLIMLRRSKTMSIRKTNLPLLGLKPMTVTFEPVPQDDSERALYCYVEMMLHYSARHGSTPESYPKSDEEKPANIKQRVKSRATFLRLLRDLCVSPYLLNGGLGCSSQLASFNTTNKDYNKVMSLHRESQKQPRGFRDHSCDEAIRFLSQIEDVARTDADFVTDVRLGGGDGISRRDRAMVSPQSLLEKARADLSSAKASIEAVQSKRARAHWHIALEAITTGRLPSAGYARVQLNILQLWNWRAHASSHGKPWNASRVPACIRRGWRPSFRFLGINPKEVDTDTRADFLRAVFQSHPSCTWAHPYALMMFGIPHEVSLTDIQESLLVIVNTVSTHSIGTISDSSSWKAIVHVESITQRDMLLRRLRSADGIRIECGKPPKWVTEKISAAESQLEEATAASKVQPCLSTQRKVYQARKEFEQANRGLVMVAQPDRQSEGNLLCVPAIGAVRSFSPKTSKSLFEGRSQQIHEATEIIQKRAPEVQRLHREKSRLENAIQNGVSDRVENLNTFDSLQALSQGQTERTFCPICHDHLGSSDANGRVALTRCGHMSCLGCMHQWMRSRVSQSLLCVECRKPVVPDQVIRIDPKKTSDRDGFKKQQEKAKNLIQQATKMLEENNGRLEAHIWEALYLSVMLPHTVDASQSGSFTAIPGNFLGHLRHSTGSPLDLGRMRGDKENKLPSKLWALLDDLPRDELSVVFASSKSIVKHIMSVLEVYGFSCRGLFTGQTEKDSEKAVSNWQTNTDVLVLVVQAGTAACGLTLTAASKMFLMEPFLKHEEEKQAYARLHRYGQNEAVMCKVYYTPVSVESRLLEWRRQATSHAADNLEAVYAPMREENHDEDEAYKEELETEDVAEQSQARYLLGLDNPGVMERWPG